MKATWLAILSLLLASLTGQNTIAQQNTRLTPDCQVNFSLSNGQSSASFDNRSSACTSWTVTYTGNSTGTVSLLFQDAPDSSGAPGTFVTFAGTVVSGTNPLVSTAQGYATFTGYYPWLNVKLTATGGGTVKGSFYGWKQQAVKAPGTPGSGDVKGPASATAGNVATFADTSGKVIQDGGPPAAPVWTRTGTTLSPTNAGDSVAIGATLLIDSANFASFAAACTAAKSVNATLLVATSWTGLTTQTCPANLHFYAATGADLKPASGQTVTLSGAIEAPLFQLFDTSLGTIVLTNVATVYPEWFGAVGDATHDDTGALRGAVAAATNIHLSAKQYYISDQITLPDGINLTGVGRDASRLVVKADFPVYKSVLYLTNGYSALFASFSIVGPNDHLLNNSQVYGLRILQGHAVSIRDLAVRNIGENSGAYAIALSIDSVQELSIIDSHVDGSGMGLEIRNCAQVAIVDSYFGGMITDRWYNSNGIVTGTMFDEGGANAQDGQGNHVFLDGGATHITFKDSTFFGNDYNPTKTGMQIAAANVDLVFEHCVIAPYNATLVNVFTATSTSSGKVVFRDSRIVGGTSGKATQIASGSTLNLVFENSIVTGTRDDSNAASVAWNSDLPALYSTLPVATSGRVACSNCDTPATPGAACSASGDTAGAEAHRIRGAWKCF